MTLKKKEDKKKQKKTRTALPITVSEHWKRTFKAIFTQR